MDRAHKDVQKARRAQRAGPSPPPPGAITPQTGEVSRAMDRFLDVLVLYDFVSREMSVSRCRITQAMWDRVYTEGLVSEHIILTGSYWEGMPRGVCGDRDRMTRQRSHPTVVFHPPAPDHSSQTQARAGHVIVSPNPAQPAYLSLLVHGMPLLTREVANSITEYNGTLYLANSAIVRRVVLPGHVAHGPATTGVAVPQNPEMGMEDNVPCLYSATWPPCAREFFTRPRSHDWPPQTLLSLIQREGCHVVGASHQATARRDLEWRWSMSVAEKELIHHLPTEMACTMYVLRAIKNHTWKEETDRPQPVCSYFLKMACLWIAELSAPNVTIMATVRSVLDWLIMCYNVNNIPHYFIPNQNLIGHLPPDTCQEMAGKLREVKSELWLCVICSVKLNSEAVINSIQGQLDITPPHQPSPEDITPPDQTTPEDITPLDQPTLENITPPDQPTPEDITPPDQSTSEDTTTPDQPTPEDRYSQLLSGLLGCDSEKAVRVLEEATQTLGPGSEMYVMEERYWAGPGSAANYTPIHETLRDHISTRQPSDVIAIPEVTGLHIIDNLPSILIKASHVDMYRASLYRHLGDIYHGLYTYYTEHRKDLPPGIHGDCKRRADRYYTEGLHLPFPDGWSDRGLTGYVRLAKFHYLNGEWGRVEGVMAKLQPLLEELGSSPQSVNALSPMPIDTRLDLCTLPWRADRPLHCPLVKECTDAYVIIQPAVLEYYIQGRLALRGDRRGQAEVCVRAMEKVVEGIQCLLEVKSTHVFIAVLKDYLKVYDIVQSLTTPQV